MLVGGGGDDGVGLVLARGDVAVEVVVAHVTGGEKVAGLHDAEAVGAGDGVEVLEGDVVDFVLGEVEVELEEVAILGLKQVEEGGLKEEGRVPYF